MHHSVPSINRCQPLLGTYVSVQLSAQTSPQADMATLLELSNLAFDEIRRIESLMSFHNPDSELSYLNREAALHPCDLSADMAKVLTTALNLSHLTHGRYDISIAPELVKHGLLPQVGQPLHEPASWQDITLTGNRISFNQPLLLDLGGIAKGYAVDRAFMTLVDDVDNMVINAGGDLRMKRWQEEAVAIKALGSGENSLINAAMQATAVATTAAYYMNPNSSRVIDPQTRQPVHDSRSISVFAPNCMLADALTKVVVLADNAAEIVRSKQATALIIDQHGSQSHLS